MTKQFWANLALSGALAAVAIFSAVNFSSALTPHGLLAFDAKPSAEAAALLPQVVLANYEVSEDPNQVVTGNFFVRNNSGKDVKNIDVMCEFSNEQGLYVDHKKWTLAQTVPAGQTVRLAQSARQFVNTNARALNCRIADFQLVQEPFFALARVAVAGHGEGHGAGHDMAPAGPHHSAPSGAGH